MTSSNFSSSFLFLPREKREAMRNVYAFFRAVDDVVDEEPDPVRQTQLLGSWKARLIQIYEGKSDAPLMDKLQKTIRRFHIPQEYFLELIAGCEMDINKKRYNAFSELYEYCYRVAGIVGLSCMKIFEYESPTSQKAAVDLGVALQLTNIIRDVGGDLSRGRIYLPQEDLVRFGVTESNLTQNGVSENFRQLMEFQYYRACDYYQKGFSEFAKDKQKKLLAARIMGGVYREILEKIRKKNYPVLTKRVSLNPFEKSILLARVFAHYYLS